MGPEHVMWGGWWMFPVVMPLVMILFLVTVLFILFGLPGSRHPWRNNPEGSSDRDADSETAMGILKKRYARGEITREEFEQIKQDLER